MKSITFSLLFIVVGLTGCMDAPTLRNQYLYAVDSIATLPEMEQENAKIHIQKVEQINQLADGIKTIDAMQNGVCDTCVTGYQSAIIENRKVAEKLSHETAELQRKVWAVQKQIQTVDSVLSSNDVQLSKLRAINMMAKRETNKQKHEFYALTKGD